MLDHSPASLRSTLKSATHDLHERSEAAARRGAPLDSEAGYATFLGAMRALYGRHRLAFDRASALARLPQRGATLFAALDSDLAALNRPRPRIEPIALSKRVDADARAWGAAYVIEGSALGAAVISREAAALIEAGAPGRYLSALEMDRKTRWPDFARRLDRAASFGEIGERPAVAAAREVFEDLIAIMEAANDARPSNGASHVGS